MNNSIIAQKMIDNIKGKFSFLANHLPDMSVQRLNKLQYVDSGTQSDTFNTVFGMPTYAYDIESITQHYRNENKPAAWWFAGSPIKYCEALQKAGWVYEENQVGMYLELPIMPVKPESVLSRVDYCDNKNICQDFGHVLSAIFEPGNTMEAENIRAIYNLVGAHNMGVSNHMIHLVGYFENEPVATATVYFKNNTAGIFDIATPEKWRNRGFGSEIFYQALQVAQQQGVTICLLQASPTGLNIYKKAGFNILENFEVWNLPGRS